MKTLRTFAEWLAIVIALMIGFGGLAAILVQVDPVRIVHARGTV